MLSTVIRMVVIAATSEWCSAMKSSRVGHRMVLVVCPRSLSIWKNNGETVVPNPVTAIIHWAGVVFVILIQLSYLQEAERSLLK